MQRYFLHIAYDGSNYRGWQRQADVCSVQETMENKLHKIFKHVVTIYGCGRTDAGVHASQYLLHINLPEPCSFDLKFRLNKNLPNNIIVHDVIPVKNRQHARYDAISRTYNYFIHLEDDPILSQYSSYYECSDLNFERMQQATELLKTGSDFKHFCKQPHLFDDTTCQLSNAQLFVSVDQKRLQLTVTANRFLRGMIRIIVTCLLEIGTGKLSIAEFQSMLKNKGEPSEKHPAHPNGLYLSKIEYPYLSIPEKGFICSLLKINN